MTLRWGEDLKEKKNRKWGLLFGGSFTTQGGGCFMWHPPLCVGSDLVLREGVGSGGLTACEGSDGRKAAASPPWTSGPGPLLTSARGRERLVAGGIGKKNRGSCGAEPHPGLRGSRPSRPGRKTRPPAEPPGGGVRVRGGGLPRAPEDQPGGGMVEFRQRPVRPLGLLRRRRPRQTQHLWGR